jgi:hypothetical protein
VLGKILWNVILASLIEPISVASAVTERCDVTWYQRRTLEVPDSNLESESG